MRVSFPLLLPVLASALPLLGFGRERMQVIYDPELPQARFAVEEIRRAAVARDFQVAEKTRPAMGLTLSVTLGSVPVADASPTRAALTNAQSYSLRVISREKETNIVVTAADPSGLMYGALDLAEAIRLGTLKTLRDSDHTPHVERRGIKFNIPLDLRTPSYSDCSDSFQANIPETWSLPFWREFLDEMARNRFNVLSLWNLHPFPSIVKVPEYPEVALDDVWRTTAPLDDTFSFSGSDMVRQPMLDHHEVVKRITMDEKIRFWRDVMQLAQDRGIEVYWFTWNTFTFGANKKYGITPALTNRTTIDYFRASVRETILTYPLLAGIGITAGEQMPARKDEFSREKWLWATYGEGIRDALKRQPGRKFRLIHRFHMTGLKEIQDGFSELPCAMDVSFKYAIAHMHSETNPPFINTALPHLSPKLRTWLTVRNDDIYSFRWGDPTFARNFIQNMPDRDKCAGFNMGPDGYCWGREFMDLDSPRPRQLVMEKQWFSFMLWGRLAYEPQTPDALFEQTLAARFPEVSAARLLRGWSAASEIIPQTTRFFWGDIDLRWFPEACLSHPRHKGFYSVRHFMEGETMPGSGIADIRRWREAVTSSQTLRETTPLQVADALDQHAAAAMEACGTNLLAGVTNQELRLTLGDIQSFAYLGRYYAAKIRGACDLALFDLTALEQQRSLALRHLEEALTQWRRYAETARSHYKPQLLNRVGFVDLNILTSKVAADVTLAKEWKPGTIPKERKPPGADTPFKL